MNMDKATFNAKYLPTEIHPMDLHTSQLSNREILKDMLKIQDSLDNLWQKDSDWTKDEENKYATLTEAQNNAYNALSIRN